VAHYKDIAESSFAQGMSWKLGGCKRIVVPGIYGSTWWCNWNSRYLYKQLLLKMNWRRYGVQGWKIKDGNKILSLVGWKSQMHWDKGRHAFKIYFIEPLFCIMPGAKIGTVNDMQMPLLSWQDGGAKRYKLRMCAAVLMELISTGKLLRRLQKESWKNWYKSKAGKAESLKCLPEGTLMEANGNRSL